MERFTMCRICLVENVRMFEVTKKTLQEFYEKLTDIPFVTEDRRPMLACAFCYTKLKQCSQFRKKCLEAEKMFAQMLNKDYEHNPSINRSQFEYLDGFITTTVEHLDIVEVCRIERDAVKEEVPAACERQYYDIEIKEEPRFEEVETENLDNSYPDQEVNPPLHSDSDSEDDVPLMKIKTEVEEEQEVPKKKRRAMKMESVSVEKKRKLEDTITAKQKKNVRSDSKSIHTTKYHTSKSDTNYKEPNIITVTKGNDSIIKKSKDNIKEVINKSNSAIDTNGRNNISKQDFKYNLISVTNNNSVDINRYQGLYTSEKPYKCEMGQKSTLIKHIRKHTDEIPNKCDICQRTYSRIRDLKRHTCRGPCEKPYKCDICQRSFGALRKDFDNHMRVHADLKPYQCDICQKSFRLKCVLVNHIRVHTGEKPYKCDVCQQRFRQGCHLKLHNIRRHTGEKPHQCEICLWRFSGASDLKKHIRIHTGEKPYKCDICQQRFTQECNLKEHTIRRHTGEKRYKCEICLRRFGCPSNLKKHIRIHTGEKPYKCDICQRGFTQKNGLTYHARTHTQQ